MQGVQKVVLDIIKTASDMGLPYIPRAAIIEEARNTSLVELDSIIVNTKRNLKRKKKKTQLEFSIDQALKVLHEKNLIKKTKRGHWKINKNAIKYIPVLCKALERQYEIYCPKCNKYEYKITKEKSKIKKKCAECGKRLHINFYKYHCPVRNMFINNPTEQCELIHGTNMSKLSKIAFPMKICYFDKNPVQATLDSAKRKIKKEGERRAKEMRYYSTDVRDPLSKHYLPKLTKED